MAHYRIFQTESGIVGLSSYFSLKTVEELFSWRVESVRQEMLYCMATESKFW